MAVLVQNALRERTCTVMAGVQFVALPEPFLGAGVVAWRVSRPLFWPSRDSCSSSVMLSFFLGALPPICILSSSPMLGKWYHAQPGR